MTTFAVMPIRSKFKYSDPCAVSMNGWKYTILMTKMRMILRGPTSGLQGERKCNTFANFRQKGDPGRSI